MVCRLVKQKDICLRINQLTKSDFRLLATRKDLHLALNMFGSKTTFCKSRTYLILCISRELFPYLLQAGIFSRLDLLFKVSYMQIIAKLRLA